MAMVYVDGFDVSDHVAKGWVITNAGGGAVSIVTTGRVGGRAVSASMNGFGSNGNTARLQRIIPAINQITLGVAVRLTNVTFGSGTFFVSLYGDAGATQHLTIMADPVSKYIQVRLGSHAGTVLATSSTQMYKGVWTYIEVQATIADAGGICKVRVNGNPTNIIDYTGDTRNGGTEATITSVSLGTAQAGGAEEIATFDDLYILDETGAANTTFLGDIRIASLLPNGAGTDTQLSPTGSATNWQNVDEVPYSTTDYNGSPTVGLRDTYALTDLAAGMTSVFAVQNNAIAAKSDVTAANAKLPLRTGGGLFYGATNTLSTSYLTYFDLYQVNPNTAVAWTPAEMNSLEVGLEVA
jgi:hypothetical protein